MKTVVLILLYWSTTGDRAAMVTQEFTSMETCQVAITKSKKEFDGMMGRNVYAFCTEK